MRTRLENATDVLLKPRGRRSKHKVRAVELDILVDTGAVMMLLPQELVETLGLVTIDRAIVALANDQKVEMDRAGNLLVTACGRKMTTDCLVGPPGCKPLAGQLILEGLDLLPDPLKCTVTTRPESPYLPTLKLK